MEVQIGTLLLNLYLVVGAMLAVGVLKLDKSFAKASGSSVGFNLALVTCLWLPMVIAALTKGGNKK